MLKTFLVTRVCNEESSKTFSRCGVLSSYAIQKYAQLGIMGSNWAVFNNARKNKAEVVTPANHKGHRQRSKPIKTLSDCM